MQSVGIEPTLLRTRALSVRLNRSAKTAPLGKRTTTHENNSMKQCQTGVRFPLGPFTFNNKKRFYRDLNPDYKDQNLGC